MRDLEMGNRKQNGDVLENGLTNSTKIDLKGS
jgi:hypothetical protein